MKIKLLLAASVATVLAASSLSAWAAGDVAAGKAVAEKFACASCHGKDLSSPIDPSYPKLAGQHADYVAQALKEYQRGAEGPNGRSHAIMSAQAKPLSHADIVNVAAYIQSLPGSLVLKK